MKRAAAIIGPTPSFVRWTILKDCPYRQLGDENQPYEAFRQLRNLREVSLAKLENRTIQGFCIHTADNANVHTTRGFPIDEVMNFFDDEATVEKTCAACPANAAKHHNGQWQQNLWAGCYGWMKSIDDGFDLPQLFSQIDDSNFRSMPDGNEKWFRVWQTQRWDGDHLRMLNAMLAEFTTTEYSDFENLKNAGSNCLHNNLILETELVPSGHSDGIKWTIAAHCKSCKFETKTSFKECPQCGGKSTWVPSSSRKVLGLRPYMILKDIIGSEGTQKLLDEFNNTPNVP